MKIGLALGSGSARGWSHIGTIRALALRGIEPDIICGTSIGSLVGASYVFGNMDRLEEWVRNLTKFGVAKFFEISTSLNGFVNTDRMHGFLTRYVADESALIESAPKQYAAVATDLETGREIWFSEGSVLQAVWASISLPGLFPALRSNNSWLVDGGLVNPVPVSVCRALGADIVIAVNLNGAIVGKHFQSNLSTKPKRIAFVDKITDLAREYTTSFLPPRKEKEPPPNLFEAIAGSVNITQDRITRSRMAGDPPDILLSPKLSHIGLLEFYRANEAIAEGEKCVQRMLPEIEHIFDTR